MNEQIGGGSVAPLFYIIQPEIHIRRSEQNNQEIFHSREVIVESARMAAPAPAEQEIAEQEKESAALKLPKQDIQEEVKQLSTEFNIPANIQEEAMKKMGELSTAQEEELIHLKDERIDKTEAILSEDKQGYDQAAPIDDEAMEERKKSVRTTVMRLARYPRVVPKPLCELTIQGEKVNAILESKRGEMVRLQIGEESQIISINDIEDIRIL